MEHSEIVVATLLAELDGVVVLRGRKMDAELVPIFKKWYLEIGNDKIHFHCLLKHRVTAIANTHIMCIVLIFKVFESFVDILWKWNGNKSPSYDVLLLFLKIEGNSSNINFNLRLKIHPRKCYFTRVKLKLERKRRRRSLGASYPIPGWSTS